MKIAIFLLFVGFLLGFLIDPLGRKTRYLLGEKIFKSPSRNSDNRNLTDNDRYVILKQFSEGNYSLIETWDMLKGMACNLAVSNIFLIFISLYKAFTNHSNYSEWVFFSFLAIIFSLSSLYQSHTFEKYSVLDMNAAIKMLNLEEKAEKLTVQ